MQKIILSLLTITVSLQSVTYNDVAQLAVATSFGILGLYKIGYEIKHKTVWKDPKAANDFYLTLSDNIRRLPQITSPREAAQLYSRFDAKKMGIKMDKWSILYNLPAPLQEQYKINSARLYADFISTEFKKLENDWEKFKKNKFPEIYKNSIEEYEKDVSELSYIESGINYMNNLHNRAISIKGCFGGFVPLAFGASWLTYFYLKNVK